jgi:hypothetical protein
MEKMVLNAGRRLGLEGSWPLTTDAEHAGLAVGKRRIKMWFTALDRSRTTGTHEISTDELSGAARDRMPTMPFTVILPLDASSIIS